MDTQSPTHDPWSHSQSFTVRLWYEPVDAGQSEVRMQAKHILTGEMRYFRDWSLLASYLTSMLDAPDVDAGQPTESAA